MISLHPIDVGFDLRAHEMSVEVPAGIVTVRYLDEHGEDVTVTGGRAEVRRQLRRAGYRVRSRPPAAAGRIVETERELGRLIVEHAKHIRDHTQRSATIEPCDCADASRASLPLISAGTIPGAGYAVRVVYWSGRERVDHEIVLRPAARSGLYDGAAQRHYSRDDAEAHVAQLEIGTWRPFAVLGDTTPTPLLYAVTRPVSEGSRYEAWLGVGTLSLSLGSYATEAIAADLATSRLAEARRRLREAVEPIVIQDGGGHCLRLAALGNAWDAIPGHVCSDGCPR